MKLHLEPKCMISNLPPTIGPIIHKNLFIYYSATNVTISDLSSNRIVHRFKYENVQVLKTHRNNLYICTNDIYILDLINFQIIDVIKLSKALISKIALFESSILIFKVNKKLSLLSSDSSHHSYGKKFEIQLDSFCNGLFLSERFFGYFDSERVAVFSNSCKMAEYESEYVLDVYPKEGSVYVLQSDGSLSEIMSGYNVNLGVEIQSGCFTPDHVLCISNSGFSRISYIGEVLEEFNINTKIEEYSGAVFDYYSHVKNNNLLTAPEFKRIKKLKVYEKDSVGEDNSITESIDESSTSERNGGTLNASSQDDADDIQSTYLQSVYATDEEDLDNGQGLDSSTSEAIGIDGIDENQDLDSSIDKKSNETDTGDLSFTFVDSELVKTSENDYIFFKDGDITRILVFADDTTDFVYFKDYLILTTSSGYLKFASINGYSKDECILDAYLLKIHNNSITACRLYKDIFITTGKDRIMNVFRVFKHRRLRFVKLFEFANFTEEVTAFAYENNLLVAATSDFIVQIFQSDQCLPDKQIDYFDANALDFLLDYSQFFNTFENISVQKLHSKAINHISLINKFIVTSSSDKSAKILSLEGNLVKIIQSDKVLHTSFDSKYIAICSHKAVKIITHPSFSPVCSFQARRPVLSSCFYHGYLLTLSDVLRVFDIDKRKCVKMYDLGLLSSWSFSFPFICAENKIVVLKDISEEKARLDADAVRLLTEHTILFSKFIYDKQFDKALDVVLKRNDEKKVYQVISQGYYHFGNLDFLKDFMKNGEVKNRVLDILMKNSSLKSSLVFNEVLSHYFIDKIDKAKKEKIREIIHKHVDAIDNIYIEILGLEAYVNRQE
ncbi:uncharacterized protein VICG_00974 [Vittaforma corneae ATCC 50505]|uniref:Uncharacterized protein n=1 Tax=Vittaforma corneae (strain ATCC 50505) TaxID=993615 RepID=L2GNQ6_VITCO|nr:uncharacterized protein VICG_00974 [Vittaforma corneae ATCC 50505]ELA41957.1 hypothetical protein VICG_00974 [Vittaforma corneae ATCC 50505]